MCHIRALYYMRAHVQIQVYIDGLHLMGGRGGVCVCKAANDVVATWVGG